MERSISKDGGLLITLGVLVSVVIVFARIIKFIPDIGVSIYYGWFIFMSCVTLVCCKISRVNIAMTCFIVCCILSILFNRIAPVFQTELRFVGFLSVVVCMGPLFDGITLCRFRDKMFLFLMWGMVGIVTISTICYFVAPSTMLTLRGGLYGGITAHSMIMSPIAAISALFLINKLMLSVHGKGCRIVLSIMVALSLISLMLAGSRSGLLAFAIAFVAWLRLYCGHNIKRFFKFVVALLILVLATMPVWWEYTETVRLKMEYSERVQGGALGSRSNLWQTRVDEIKDNPLFGVGFATTTDKVGERGEVEPGNGWLFVASSAGVLAFLFFAAVYLRILVKLLKYPKDKNRVLLAVVLLFIAIHLNGEGYTLSGGSFMFFVLWLSLGLGYSYLKQGIVVSSCYRVC